MRVPTGGEIPNRTQAGGDRLFGNHFAVDADSLAECDEVRGDEQAGAVPSGAGNRIDHGANRSLAVCAGNMDHARPAKIDM